MPSPLYATATQLEQYANHPEAAHELPRIVRRLIHASEPRLTNLHFPAGKSTTTGGWDGLVEGASGSNKVPAGRSVWELSTEKEPAAKAQRDYRKRSFENEVPDRQELTFVHVNLRSWNTRKDWVARKKAESDYPWKNLEAYDADDLQEWLEQHPALHAWVSRLMGLRPPHVDDLEGLWERWSKVTQPVFSPALLLAGRELQAQKVLQWLQGEPSFLALQAETREEATMFLAAVLLREGANADLHLARAIRISNAEVWDQMQGNPDSPLILIPDFEERDHVQQATQKGHHVFLPLGRSGETTSSTVRLPVLQQEVALGVLMELGVQEHDAAQLLKQSRERVPVLRRLLMPDRSSLTRPSWANANAAAQLIPLMLVGSWDEDHEADSQVITQLARQDTDQLQNQLTPWLSVEDAPIQKEGSVWQVVAMEDAWALLSRHLTQAHLKAFHQVVLQVLGEAHPKYDLSPDDRSFAPLKGQNLTHSKWLRKGLARTLAVMGSQDWTGNPRKDGRDLVEQTVRLLLKNADWKRWASLSDVLSELAEAAPDIFLDAVQRHLDAVLETFQPDGWGNSPHVSMMFALEVLAWSPTHLAQVTRILSDLKVIDVEITRSTGKSPCDTLYLIFNPCWPQTTATAEERLGVMAGLHRQERYRKTAQQLYLLQLPNLHRSTVFGTAKPSWQPWLKNFQHTEGKADYLRLLNSSLDVLLKDANSEPSAYIWKHLLKKVRALRGKRQSRVLQTLQNLDPERLSSRDRAVVCTEIRDLLHQAATYQDDPWLNTDEPQTIFNERLVALAPTAVKDKYLWLFQNDPKIAELPMFPYQIYGAELHRLQVEATAEIFALDGLKGLLGFAQHLDEYHAGVLGHQAVHVEALVDQEDELLQNTLGREDTAWKEFAQGYVAHRFSLLGWSWADGILHRLVWELPMEGQLHFFLSLPQQSATWDRLTRAPQHLVDAYWQALPVVKVGRVQDMEHVTEQLLGQNRPWFTLDAIGSFLSHEYHVPVRSPLILKAIDACVSKNSIQETIPGNMLWYHVKVVFEHLKNARDITAFQLAEIEWKLMPFFTMPGQSPTHLHHWMVARPEFFAEVMRILQSPVKADSPDAETQQNRKRGAFNVISSFKNGPDLGFSGKALTFILAKWAPRALAACTAVGCDATQELGSVLSHCEGEDIWPPEPVRQLIEELASETFEEGVLVGCLNQRGVVKKAPREGGAQEHALSKRFQEDAEALRVEYPRTSRLLRKLAASYRKEGTHDDEMDILEH